MIISFYFIIGFYLKKKKDKLEEISRIQSRNSPALQDHSPPSPQAQQDPPPPSPVELPNDKENQNNVPRKRGRKTKSNKST